MKEKKIKAISFSNRKKQLTFTYTTGKKVSIHYSQLGIRSHISRVWIDKETNNQSVGLELSNGKIDYVPYDQPLALVKDTDYLLQNQIEILISYIKEAIRIRKLSKRYLAEQLKTSDNQIQRLLNPKILNKNLFQLYQIASFLGLEIKFDVKKAA